MYVFLIAVHVIASLVLVVTILLQAGRGGGLSEAFGSSSTSTIFGTSASTFLQRATAVCAIVFLLTSLSLAVLSSRRSRSLMRLENLRRALPQAQRQAMPTRGDQGVSIPLEGPEEAAPIEAPEEAVPAEEPKGTIPFEPAQEPVTE
jgi:preprotein translocase subunit SecG